MSSNLRRIAGQQQLEKDRCLTPQEMKVLSLWVGEDQLGVLLGSPAWVNSTGSTIRPVNNVFREGVIGNMKQVVHDFRDPLSTISLRNFGKTKASKFDF